MDQPREINEPFPYINPVYHAHHSHDGLDSLGGGLLPTGCVDNGGSEVGHVEGDSLQDAVRGLTAFLLQL